MHPDRVFDTFLEDARPSLAEGLFFLQVCFMLIILLAGCHLSRLKLREISLMVLSSCNAFLQMGVLAVFMHQLMHLQVEIFVHFVYSLAGVCVKLPHVSCIDLGLH